MRGSWAEQEPRPDGGEDRREDGVEGATRDDADEKDAENRTGYACDGERDTTAVVDASLTRVGEGTRGCVDEDDGKADRGDRLRRFAGIDDEEDGREQETATNSHERAERPNGES